MKSSSTTKNKVDDVGKDGTSRNDNDKDNVSDDGSL